jgi:hypothetical protein
MTPCRVVLGLSWLLIALVGSAEGRDEPRGVRVSEAMLHGDMDCFKVETPTATYL